MIDIINKTYLVATSTGRWARGSTLLLALREANALNKGNKGDKIRKGLEVVAWLNLQTEADRLTTEQVEAMERDVFCRITGYKAGEFMEPFVGSYGNPIARGILEKIDLI